MTGSDSIPFRACFVRHAKVAVDLDKPSTEWPLIPGFEKDLEPILNRLRHASSIAIWTSPEQKAKTCADFLAEALTLPVREIPGLAEHYRGDAHRPISRAEFEDTMAEFFSRPNECVFGTETARAALARITDAVEYVRSFGSEGAIIVTHGTVLSLFLAQQNYGVGLDIWKRLTMPDLVEIDL